jgi:hypothetical protein
MTAIPVEESRFTLSQREQAAHVQMERAVFVVFTMVVIACGVISIYTTAKGLVTVTDVRLIFLPFPAFREARICTVAGRIGGAKSLVSLP